MEQKLQDTVTALVANRTQKQTGRKVWSIDLEAVWLPFFTATNTEGKTAIPAESLGAPLRLAYNKDGTVKFTEAGRPIIRVEKEIGANVKLVRENFVAGLLAYAKGVATENAEGFKATIEASVKAGAPIQTRDADNLVNAVAARAAADAEAAAEAAERAAAKVAKRATKHGAPEREKVAA